MQSAREFLEAARGAMHRREWQAAAALWIQFREIAPDDADGFTGYGMVLRELHRFDEAEILLAEARRRFVDNAQVAIDYAWVAHQRGDLTEAAERWNHVIERFANRPEGPLGLGAAKRDTKNYAEADRILGEAVKRFPDNPGLAINRAWVAHQQRDWEEAIPRWRSAREKFPDTVEAAVGLGAALRDSGDFEAAEQALIAARAQFPSHFELGLQHATTAYFRGDLTEATRRLEQLQVQHPDSHRISSLISEIEYRRKIEDAESSNGFVEQNLSEYTSDEHKELMLAFESLGDNCEFGVVQRRFGAEPLGLLRWTSTSPEKLIDALEHQLEGIGSVENTTLTLIGNEYITRDKRWGMVMHTFIYEHQASHDELLPKLRRRLQFLHNKLLDDLRQAEKILVYKSATITESEIRRLHSALSKYGRNTLLCVTLEDEAHPNGCAERVENGLIRGYIRNFAPAGQVDRLLPESCSWWLSICRKALPLLRHPKMSGFDEREVQSTAQYPETDKTKSDALTRLSVSGLMLEFESLGSGCEFGLVQRHFGAEPLGVLRWGEIPPLKLAEALTAKFEGIGDAENVEILETDNEYFFRDNKYNIRMHTFIPVNSQSPDKLRMQQSKRIKYLSRKLLEDLQEAHKIFVYKRHAGSLIDEEVYPIYRAIRNYGNNTLMCVLPEEPPEYPNGTILVKDAGLLYAYIDSLSPTSYAPEIKYESWLALLREAHRLWCEGETEPRNEEFVEPISFNDLARRAWELLHSNDFAGAARLWSQARELAPENPVSHIGLALSFSRSEQFDAADEVIDAALPRFPDNQEIAANSAWIAHNRSDWKEAEIRWKAYRSRFSQDPIGFLGHGLVLRHLERFDEAEEIFLKGLELHPDHAELLANYAWVPHKRGDWPEALKRWTVYRDKYPQDMVVYASLGTALRELERFDEADATLQEGLRRYPENGELLSNYAWVAHKRRDWPEALKRWMTFRDKFPDQSLGTQQVMLVRRELGRFDEAPVFSSLVALSQASAPDSVTLMLAFESLGDDCEFGVVQRHYGAEPLGLLRFAATPPKLLTAALRDNLAGVGDAANTTLRVYNGEYMTGDTRYHMAMHTFIRAGNDDREKRFNNICRRIKYLRDKLLGDLELAEKHFVYAYRENLDDADIEAMWRAMRVYGDNRLLFVQPQTAAFPAGTVRIVNDSLVVGYLDKVSVENPSFDLWLELCQNAYRHWTPGT